MDADFPSTLKSDNSSETATETGQVTQNFRRYNIFYKGGIGSYALSLLVIAYFRHETEQLSNL